MKGKSYYKGDDEEKKVSNDLFTLQKTVRKQQIYNSRYNFFSMIYITIFLKEMEGQKVVLLPFFILKIQNITYNFIFGIPTAACLVNLHIRKGSSKQWKIKK